MHGPRLELCGEFSKALIICIVWRGNAYTWLCNLTTQMPNNHIITVHEPSGPANWDVLTFISDEEAIRIGNRLHLLDLLIEIIQFNPFADLHVDEYARALIDRGQSEWPFADFPESQAVQDMYVQRTDGCEFTYF